MEARIDIGQRRLNEPVGEPRKRGPAAADVRLQRRVGLLLALSGLALLLSLLPTVTFTLAASARPDAAAVLSPVYPGHGVQQELEHFNGAVLKARIWVAAGLDGPPVPVDAALVAGPDGAVVRQVTFEAAPSLRPVATDLLFAPYDPPDGPLTLQLSVAPEAGNFMSLGIAQLDPHRHREFKQVALNGDPMSYLGPLAHEFEGRGSGLRAALLHGGPDRLRLAFALAALGAGGAVGLAGARIGRALLAIPPLTRQARGRPAGRRRFIYPWLVILYPVVYLFSRNLLTFEFRELAASAVIVTVLVTAAMLISGAILKDFALAAAITTLLGIVFMTYGYIFDGMGRFADHRVLLPAAAIVALVGARLLYAFPRSVRDSGRFMNYAAVVLLALPLIGVGRFYLERPQLDLAGVTISDAAAGPADSTMPDIYYLILDEYGREDTLTGFDNSEFLDAMRDRGFYVPAAAASNYPSTEASIPSSLNMQYYEGLETWGDAQARAAQQMATDNVLGRTLQRQGYEYIHVRSGFPVTNDSPNADRLVDFGMSGTILRDQGAGESMALFTPGDLAREVVRRTALRPFLPADFATSFKPAYSWWQPARTLATFEFLKGVPALDGPVFTFAHILKPHGPNSFDRFGNVSNDSERGFGADHDPGVSDPYFGQLIHINKLVLETVDAILAGSEVTPIIVISADHGRRNQPEDVIHSIFAAYLLPDGGNQVLYPTISSVNSFRAVLDYYFGLDLGLLEDRSYKF